MLTVTRPEQYLQLYDINVVGCQRLNQAVLPHMRSKRRGHFIWISSSSCYGAKSPMLGGYFAAKTAMDSLAQTYARELHLWGIETSVVLPGLFTKVCLPPYLHLLRYDGYWYTVRMLIPNKM